VPRIINPNPNPNPTPSPSPNPNPNPHPNPTPNPKEEDPRTELGKYTPQKIDFLNGSLYEVLLFESYNNFCV
jgi:hypothetical protein